MKKRKKSSTPRILSLVMVASLVGGYFWLRAGVASTEPDPETVRVLRETLDRTVLATASTSRLSKFESKRGIR